VDTFNASVAQCVGVTHRFTANVSATTGGSALSYPDEVAGSAWSLHAVAAASGASLSPFKGTPVLLSGVAAGSAVEAYSAVQASWLLRGSRGLAIAPGAAPSSLGASGRGFAVAVWFRVDDAGVSNAAPSAVLQLTLAAGTAANVTLTLVSTVARGATVALVARRVVNAGASALSDSDAAISSSSDDFPGPAASRPNAGLSSVGRWQHAVFSFGSNGVQDGLFWNGVAANITGIEAVYATTLFGNAPPYSLLGGAVGYDAQGSLNPLWGAVGDVQLYDFAVTQHMAHGLFAGHLDACIPLPPSKKGGLTTGQTAGIVIGSFFGCTCSVTFILFHALRKSKKIAQPEKTVEEADF
jgi:hypothetical protein